MLTPVLNFFDQRSILSWYDVRSVFLTTGARFSLRTEIYLGIFVIIDMTLAVVFCIRLIVYEKNLVEDSCQALALIYITIITSFLFHTLFKGAYINTQANDQFCRLTEIKLFLEQMSNDYELLFGSQMTKNIA